MLFAPINSHSYAESKKGMRIPAWLEDLAYMNKLVREMINIDVDSNGYDILP